MRHPLACVSACALALAATTGVARAQDGFTPQHAAQQRQFEASFQEGVSADDMRSLSRSFSRRPHLVGTPNQRRVVESALAKLKSYGLDASMQSYDIYISRPESIQVSMTNQFPRLHPRSTTGRPSASTTRVASACSIDSGGADAARATAAERRMGINSDASATNRCGEFMRREA